MRIETRRIYGMAAVAGLLFSGLAAAQQQPSPQQPFICRTQESGLGQPLVDNQQGIGHPVFDSNKELIGYSQNCAIPPRTQTFVYDGKGFQPADSGAQPSDKRLVVRVEGGVINRFLYTIAMPPQWNGKLIYWLRGGVGIGHQQGLAMWFNGGLSPSEKELLPRLLALGYAVASSSGNETGVHYNMRLAEQTAALTKAHFVEAYGAPRFTISIGGSGGAVQQYLFAQNRPGLLDGGIAIQSYPDMITQTIPIADCPLLGQYFRDEVARDPASRWARWSEQRLIEGMNASDTVRNEITGKPGSTECIHGWRMAMPTVLNPRFKDPRFDRGARAYGYPANVFDQVKWTHWNDLADIYGADQQGFAPIPLDNVGVQYGLAALLQGQLSTDEFLRLNACVGSWKEQAEFVDWRMDEDPFDSRNMRRSASCRSPEGVPAPRRSGSAEAIRAAYGTGQVFTGQRLSMPLIDLRPYLEQELNMHNARQSFSARARLQAANAQDASRQVIWFAPSDAGLADHILQALAVLDDYLGSGKRPAQFVDQCFDAGGAVLAAGAGVWDGILDQREAGACTRRYPIFSSPRMVAGGAIQGDVFKCALKPLERALADGTYGGNDPARFTPAQRQWLARIFPEGVCDFTRPPQ